MTEHTDPFEVLRELDPVAPGEVRGAAASLQARTSLEAILVDERAPPRSSGRRRARLPRRKRVYALAGIAVAIGAGSTSWALTRASTVLRVDVVCYASTTRQHGFVVSQQAGVAAADSCRGLWKQTFGVPAPAALQPCELASGEIAVFPGAGSQVCQRLHLPTLSSAPPGRLGVTALALQNKLDSATGRRCLDRNEALAVARAQLAAGGLAGWQVQSTLPFTKAQPCASWSIDETNHVLSITPVPRMR